jgi:glycosyltransferase involved in cell wall biosynthesis
MWSRRWSNTTSTSGETGTRFASWCSTTRAWRTRRSTSRCWRRPARTIPSSTSARAGRSSPSPTALRIAAKIYPEEQHYFDETLAPLIKASAPLVEFIGEIDDRGRDDLLGHAAALLFPIEWPEPFGLAMIEALACGTPVIAWRRGSVPEVIDDGVKCYITESVEDAVDAVATIDRLSRSGCRRAFEERFDADRMAADYVDVYRRVIAVG